MIVVFIFFSDYLFKLLLIGDSGVGKSCLLLRFAVSTLTCLCYWKKYYTIRNGTKILIGKNLISHN